MKYWLLILLCICVINPVMAQNYDIGVLAYDGKQQAIKRWQPTANYLTRRIPNTSFNVIPLTHDEFEHAINKDELSFILTNPGHYVRLEVKFGITRIATFLTQYKDQTLKQFSSVIFTLNNSPIKTLRDLKGQTLAAVNENAFGGFQLAQDALKVLEIDALSEIDVKWLGFPHSDVVTAVVEGRANAGTVRSGVLEKMADKQLLDLSSIRILSNRVTPGFPLLHSVDLYPEWPFSKLPNTDTALAKKVVTALFDMNRHDEAAIQAGGSGWTIPLNYASIHEVLRRLQADPYPAVPLNLSRFISVYKQWLIAFLILILITLVVMIRLFRTNQQLKITQQQLHDHQTQLEETVQQRTDELLQTNQTLQIEIASHRQAEQVLNEGSESLRELYNIFNRVDLDREQKLNSIVESVRQYLCAEFALLSSIQGGEYKICSISPSNSPLKAPLSEELSQLSISERQIIIRQNIAQWREYISCPVIVEGELFCLFEFASSTNFQNENHLEEGHFSSELSLSILNLIAQWVGYETRMLEQEKRSQQKNEDVQHRFEDLSPREREVLQLLVQGESTKAMARQLSISPKTIEMHRANLLRKTQAKSSTELVQLTVMSGLFE